AQARIDGSQPAVFSQVKRGEIGRSRFEQRGVICADGFGVRRLSPQSMKLGHRNSLHQPVDQKPSMGLRRILVRSYTLVEVKPYNLSPFNHFGFDQLIEKLALRLRRSKDADGSASLGHKAAYLRSDTGGRGLKRLLAGRTDENIEFIHAKAVNRCS